MLPSRPSRGRLLLERVEQPGQERGVHPATGVGHGEQDVTVERVDGDGDGEMIRVESRDDRPVE